MTNKLQVPVRKAKSNLQQSKRHFMGTCLSGMLAIGTAPYLALAAPLANASDSADFTDMVGSTFYLANITGSEQSKVKLVSVQELPSSDKLHQFVLHFQSSRNRDILPEGLYSATNRSKQPSFDVHIQPVGSNDQGEALYIANFANFRS